MTGNNDQEETEHNRSDLEKSNRCVSVNEACETRLDLERTYIDGKMRRFYLLFAVNGGAFAIVQLAKGEEGLKFIGNINISILSAGVMLFTALMLIDLWVYARGIRNMESRWIKQKAIDGNDNGDPRVFSAYGKCIILGMWVLLSGGWFLAAGGENMQTQFWPKFFLHFAALFNIVGAILMISVWFRDDFLVSNLKEPK